LLRQIVAALATAVRKDGIEDVKDYILRSVSDEKIKELLTLMTQRVVSTKNAELMAALGISNPLGFDFFKDDPRMVAEIEKWINENVELIKSISQEYLGKVTTIINESFIQGVTASNVASAISEATGATYKRAKLIARNEISNLNAAIDLTHAEELNIVEYVWRTSRDERVRGNPSGKYPNATPSHHDREGKVYSISEGAGGSDVHPGIGILCRCTMEMVIEI
jgi:SPP1 gp7 family putative phage head morphogenesis protein